MRASKAPAPSLSGDGTKVAFLSDLPRLVPGDGDDRDVFVKDLRTGEITRASTTALRRDLRRAVYQPTLSADGNVVAFGATGRAAPRAAHGVFLKDLRTGAVTRASLDPDGRDLGGYRPSLSGDGTRVAFSTSGNVYVKDLRNAGLVKGTPLFDDRPTWRRVLSLFS